MRTVYNNHERFEKVYFQMFDGYYLAGDGCCRDADGYYWITGRVDGVINVSGHRMGTAEVESALVKTRSGKIMRRTLRKIANDEFDSLNGTSTLADPEVFDNLIEGHQRLISN